jgi:hypothetical protein
MPASPGSDSESTRRNEVMPEKPHETAPLFDIDPPEAVELLRNALRGLRFGEVKVIIQDGVVVQVERTERTRPTVSKSKRASKS